MVTYAIGDIQGCGATLRRLLDRLRAAGFDEGADTLWLVGDLVNRGPRSLDVLRWAVAQQQLMGPRFVTVLGNHDVHLLAVAGGVASERKADTLDEVLEAPDVDELVDWLRRQPLLHRANVGARPHLLVHAGLLPQWSAADAASLAQQVERELAGPDWPVVVAQLRQHKSEVWDDSLEGSERLGAIMAGLLWIRTCKPSGRLCADFKGAPDEAPSGCVPWFDVPGRRNVDHIVVCGHWAALGLHLRNDLVAIDTGCVWGGALTAVRLEDRAVFSEPDADGGRERSR